MIVWRISNHPTLDGGGGLRVSARWHTKGRRIIYCAFNPATTLLEYLVHAEVDIEDMPVICKLLKTNIPDDTVPQITQRDDLPHSWAFDVAYTRQIGDYWLAAGETALLQVPSAIVPETWNVLINPAHSDSDRIRIVEELQHPLDARLL